MHSHTADFSTNPTLLQAKTGALFLKPAACAPPSIVLREKTQNFAQFYLYDLCLNAPRALYIKVVRVKKYKKGVQKIKYAVCRYLRRRAVARGEVQAACDMFPL